MAKYGDNIINEIVKLIKSDSFTIAEICEHVGIAESTFYEWKATKLEFSEAIKKAQEQWNEKILKDCKSSLKKLVNGYEYEEKYYESGKLLKKIKKEVQPNLGAIIHVQTNLDPKSWKNAKYVTVNEENESNEDNSPVMLLPGGKEIEI